MHAVISHYSAFKFLDMCARLIPPPEYRFHLHEYADEKSPELADSKADLSKFSFERFRWDSHPVDILVPSRAQLRYIKGFKHHSACGRFTDAPFFDAGGGVLVCSAPLLFVQLCRGKTLEQCIKIGSNICGLYSLEPSSPDGIVGRNQLATKEELSTFVKAHPRLRGSRNAAAALPWILERARSPKETELAMAFYLPKRLGGYGFAPPVMNAPVEIDGEAREISDDYSNEVDVYWPDQKIGFEYNSYSRHGDARKFGLDRRRALALRSMDIIVEFVTNEQLGDPHQLAVLAHILEERGVPLVGPSR